VRSIPTLVGGGEMHLFKYQKRITMKNINPMKIKSTLSSLFFASAFVALINCSGKKEEAKESHDEHVVDSTEQVAEEISKPQFEVDRKFQEQLAGIFTSYVELKDAFVASDAAKVKEKAFVVSTFVAKADMMLLTGAAHNDWMSYLKPIQHALKEIISSTDIEVQRKAFSALSDNLYKSIKAFGLGGKEAFYEFCPMAFNNEGAHWLSSEQQIRNPYFGDKMLTCGMVKEKLK
jgi:hypothetical protein